MATEKVRLGPLNRAGTRAWDSKPRALCPAKQPRTVSGFVLSPLPHTQRSILCFHSPGPLRQEDPGGALMSRWHKQLCSRPPQCHAWCHSLGVGQRARFGDGLLARTPELEPLFRDVLSQPLQSSLVTPGQLLCDQRSVWWQAIRPKECSLSRTQKDLSSHKAFLLPWLQLVDHTAFSYCRRWGYSHTKLWLYWNHGSTWA